MDTRNENKVVRDARGRARRMARTGGGTYQRCLDTVAQAEGHAHWKAFMATYSSYEPKPDPIVCSVLPTPRPDVAAMARQRWLSGFTGAILYEQDAELTKAFHESPAMAAGLSPRQRLRTIALAMTCAVAAGLILALSTFREGNDAVDHLRHAVAAFSIAPLLTMALALGVGALVGDHDGAQHLRVRCRSFFTGLQLLVFLYGYAGLVAAHQPSVAWLYTDVAPGLIIIRTIAGILLCNMLGRIAFRSMIIGRIMRSEPCEPCG